MALVLIFLFLFFLTIGDSQVVRVVKNPSANAGDMRCGFSPSVGKIPWRRASGLKRLSMQAHILLRLPRWY